MARPFRPHVLGVDDGPVDKSSRAAVRIVGVMLEGHDLVEAVATTEFPVDGDGAAEFLAQWIGGLRFASSLHGVVLGGISIAGLGIVDISGLAGRLDAPVLVVNRHDPRNDQLGQALAAAGLAERMSIVEKTPAAWRVGDGLYVSCAGASRSDAERLILATRHKSQFPEPLRLAHLIAGAIASGQSRGRP